MTLIIFQVIVQTVSSTLHWLGLCFGIRTWAGPSPRRWLWLTGTTLGSAAWLVAIMLLAGNNFFRNGVLPPRIPMAMVLTLGFGYLLLLSALAHWDPDLPSSRRRIYCPVSSGGAASGLCDTGRGR
jgi:hypothetical protein